MTFAPPESRNRLALLPVLMLGGLLWFMRREMSGAAQDLQEASRISLDMVSKHGLNADDNLSASLPSRSRSPGCQPVLRKRPR